MAAMKGTAKMKRKLFFGWWIVRACAIAMFARAGIVFYPFSIFLKEQPRRFTGAGARSRWP